MTAVLRRVGKEPVQENLQADVLRTFFFPFGWNVFWWEIPTWLYWHFPLPFPSRIHVWSWLLVQKLIACLEASCASLAKVNMKFPGGCIDQVQRLCPTGPDSSAGVPMPPPTAPTLRQGAGLGHHKLVAKGLDWHWGGRNLSVFTLLIHVDRNFWEKRLWFLCSFLLNIRGPSSVQTQLPAPCGHPVIACLAGSLSSACLLTASAHPSAPPRGVVPSLLGCCETSLLSVYEEPHSLEELELCKCILSFRILQDERHLSVWQTEKANVYRNHANHLWNKASGLRPNNCFRLQHQVRTTDLQGSAKCLEAAAVPLLEGPAGAGDCQGNSGTGVVSLHRESEPRSRMTLAGWCWAAGPAGGSHISKDTASRFAMESFPSWFFPPGGEGRRIEMGEVVRHMSAAEQVTWERQCKFRAGKIHRATFFMAILHA